VGSYSTNRQGNYVKCRQECIRLVQKQAHIDADIRNMESLVFTIELNGTTADSTYHDYKEKQSYTNLMITWLSTPPFAKLQLPSTVCINGFDKTATLRLITSSPQLTCERGRVQINPSTDNFKPTPFQSTHSLRPVLNERFSEIADFSKEVSSLIQANLPWSTAPTQIVETMNNSLIKYIFNTRNFRKAALDCGAFALRELVNAGFLRLVRSAYSEGSVETLNRVIKNLNIIIEGESPFSPRRKLLAKQLLKELFKKTLIFETFSSANTPLDFLMQSPTDLLPECGNILGMSFDSHRTFTNSLHNRNFLDQPLLLLRKAANQIIIMTSSNIAISTHLDTRIANSPYFNSTKFNIGLNTLSILYILFNSTISRRVMPNNTTLNNLHTFIGSTICKIAIEKLCIETPTIASQAIQTIYFIREISDFFNAHTIYRDSKPLRSLLMIKSLASTCCTIFSCLNMLRAR